MNERVLFNAPSTEEEEACTRSISDLVIVRYNMFISTRVVCCFKIFSNVIKYVEKLCTYMLQFARLIFLGS